MNTQTHRGDEAQIAEQAAEWISDLQEAEEKRAAFFDWLKASPRHVEETLFVLTLTREASALDKGESDALLSEVKRLAVPGARNVVPLTPDAQPKPLSSSSGRPRTARRWPWMEMAAAIALAAVLSWVWLAWPTVGEYATQAGEQRMLALDDGTLVHLNTRARVRVNYSPEGRTLQLMEGEALFTVRRDPKRPFKVKTHDTVVEALGTQFNVRQRRGDTRVAVLEGLVQVSGESEAHSGERVAAGEQVDVARGRIGERTPMDLTKTMAWRQRRLVFENDTLATIAVEFNRYSPKIEIQVDASVADERFTGTFDADAPERFIAAVAANRLLDVARDGDRIVIRER